MVKRLVPKVGFSGQFTGNVAGSRGFNCCKGTNRYLVHCFVRPKPRHDGPGITVLARRFWTNTD